MPAGWRFKAMTPGDLNIDPFEKEFFATEALGTRTDALVREAVQNSLDAAWPGEAVRVRFSLARAGADATAGLLDGLWPHVEAMRRARGALPDRDEPATFLLVEDFGTRGLEGDPEQFEDEDDDRGAGGGKDAGRAGSGAGLLCGRNDFYYFWRNVGRSRKSSGERGRWGLGKTVFPAASRLHSFLALTVRRRDRRALLMGQAVLETHRVKGKRFAPYGYWGKHHNGLALPVVDAATIARVQRGLRLERGGAPGLSVAIPFPEEEITAERLVESVIHHYFHPLVAGSLEVEVESEKGRVVLGKETVESAARELSPERKKLNLPLLTLARWGLDPPEESRAELAAPPAGRAPKLTAKLLDPKDLDRLRQRFEAGSRIALDLSVPITPTGTEPLGGRFRLFLERDEKLARGEGHFVRQGITIANPSARRPGGVRWIVVVTDAALSSLLGDAENPAHTEWQRSSGRLKAGYRRGPSTIDFVKGSPRAVTDLLSRPAAGVDRNLLRSVFSLPRPAALESPEGRKASRGEDEEARSLDEGSPEIAGCTPLSIARIERGFRLGAPPGSLLPRKIEVRLAYRVLRGDPLRRYTPLDFEVDRAPIEVRARGARITEQRENVIGVEVKSERFEVTARGFDSHRDLHIKIETEGRWEGGTRAAAGTESGSGSESESAAGTAAAESAAETDSASESAAESAAETETDSASESETRT